MGHRRQLGVGSEEGSELSNKRRNILWNLFKADERNLGELARSLEPLIRRCVREEVESSIDQLRYPQNQLVSSGSRTLQLQFRSNLPQTLFTSSMVLAVDKIPIKVVLYDLRSEEIVTSGPLSSIKVKIVVLDADFGPDEDWTKKDFEGKIVQNREGKRPLVTGDLMVTLQDGVGYVGDIVFTDNSSWIRSGKFRLGAKVHSVIDNISIKEGLSNAFKVKDHRGESYQKHYPPLLDDEVWRLEKIAKDGAYHKKLRHQGISSVQEFLRLYFTDKFALRTMLPNISNKAWDTIIGHATTCTLDDQTYVYRTVQGASLFFNSIFDVVGVTFDGKSFHSVDNLNGYHKGLVEDLKQHAYRNIEAWVPVSNPPNGGYPMLLPSPALNHFNNPKFGLQENKFKKQDQLEMQMNTVHQSISQESSSFEVNTTFQDSFGIMNSPGFYRGGHVWASGGNYMGSQLSTDDIPVNDNIQVESCVWQAMGCRMLVYFLLLMIIMEWLSPGTGAPKRGGAKLWQHSSGGYWSSVKWLQENGIDTSCSEVPGEIGGDMVKEARGSGEGIKVYRRRKLMRFMIVKA